MGARLILLAIVFGILGILARLGIMASFQLRTDQIFLGTLTISIVGSLLIEVLYGVSRQRRWRDSDLYRALTMGLLGGFTTFSAFSLEALQLIQAERWAAAVAYAAASPALGIAAASVGYFLTRV